MALDLTSLEKAVASLERALATAHSVEFISKLTAAQQELIRSGVIQTFEFTYELCWKFIQRWLRANTTPEDADHPRTRKELFRMAARCDLIKDPLSWFAYSDARNMISHTYDEETAEQVYETSARFVEDAKYMLDQLEQRND